MNIVQSTAKTLITKLLHQWQSRKYCKIYDNDHDNDSIFDSLYQHLRIFRRIKHLHVELHTDISYTNDKFLKWKATYGKEFKTCTMLCGRVSFCHFSSSESWLELQLNSMDYKFDRWKMWLSSFMTEASKRHYLVKQMVVWFLTLETVTFINMKRQGRFSMEKADI